MGDGRNDRLIRKWRDFKGLYLFTLMSVKKLTSPSFTSTSKIFPGNTKAIIKYDFIILYKGRKRM